MYKSTFIKYTLIALLVLIPGMTNAQQSHVYADVGLPAGFSATYNYAVNKHLGIGAGIQGNKIWRPYYSDRRFTPALFVDLRINAWATKKNQFFTFLDLGINMYKQDKSYYGDSTSFARVPHNNGFYSGLGIGYFHRITPRGGGLYLTLKFAANWHTTVSYSIVSEQQDIKLLSLDGNFPLSIGFKF